MNARPRILLVEDDRLQAMDLTKALQDATFDVAGVASATKSALSLIDTVAFDFAVLDYNLKGATSVDVAIRLRCDGVSFVYVTGAIADLLANKAAPQAEIFQKPYVQSQLIDFIRRHTTDIKCQTDSSPDYPEVRRSTRSRYL